MMAQEAAVKVVASSNLRRLVAFNKSFNCTNVKIGDTALYFKTTNKKSMPWRRGPALILDIDETGVTAKFQSQTFTVARFRVRKKAEEKDAEDAELDPLRARFRRIGADSGGQTRQVGGWESYLEHGCAGV